MKSMMWLLLVSGLLLFIPQCVNMEGVLKTEHEKNMEKKEIMKALVSLMKQNKMKIEDSKVAEFDPDEQDQAIRHVAQRDEPPLPIELASMFRK